MDRRPTVTLPFGDGGSVVVRLPGIVELSSMGFDPALLNPKTPESLRAQRAADFAEDIPRMLDFARKLLGVVMVDPKLWTGAEDQCPEDSVTMAVLGDDALAIMTAVLGAMGEPAAREAAEEAETFRGEPNGAAGEPGGADVRDESAEHSGDGVDSRGVA
jgi:hypothetical protein